MRSGAQKPQRGKLSALVVLLTFGLVCGVSLSTPASMGSSAEPLMQIEMTNGSSRNIHHLYLSPVDRDVWGPDLLTEGTVVKPGETFIITDVTCGGNEIKIVAEDRQGCFVYGVLGCAQASTTWTLTDAMPADCGN